MRDSLFPELEVRVHAVALTLDQCQEWNLPSTPLKDTELRAVKWQAAMGREQTELDAAVALVPEAFAQVVDDSLSQYFDNGLKDRGEEESAELEYWANARLAEHLGDDALVNIRARAAARLDEISELVDQVNDALRFDPTEAGIDLPPAPIPIHGDTTDGAAPLFDSANDWTHATLRLIERKSYGQEVQA